MQLTHNSLLQGGKYHIEKVLGQGGFGITYLGEQVALGRKVAIKEFFMKEYCNRDTVTSQVSVGSLGSKETVERFRLKFIKEAQTIANLNHPNIIHIHDIFEENGTAYYVMEYLNGGSLSEYQKGKGALDETEALDFVRQIANALKYIHERKINHLDVKPGNILLGEDNKAVLIDFGLSKRYDNDGNQTSTTPVGISHGYAPMEQYKKGGVGVFSPSTDIYSLGATFYKLVTGETPPDANDVADEEIGLPELPSRISKSTAAAIKQAMKPGRKQRPQSVEEFLALINDVKIGSERRVKKEKPESVSEATVFEEDTKDKTKYNTTPASKKRFNFPRKVVFGVVGVLLIVFGIFLIKSFIGGGSRLESQSLLSYNDLQESIGGAEYGHYWVDLGLSVKWATCNIGAISPWDYGDYYAWGETTVKSEYTLANSKTTNKRLRDISGNSQYDVARSRWGGDWRIPTMDEWVELNDRCKWQWVNINGCDGYKVTGPSNNSIFLPAAVYYGDSMRESGYYGKYWSSSPVESSTNTKHALCFFFKEDFHYQTAFDRYHQQSIRPVLTKRELKQPIDSI